MGKYFSKSFDKKKFKNICLLAFVPVSESVEDAVMILIKVSLTGVLNF